MDSYRQVGIMIEYASKLASQIKVSLTRRQFRELHKSHLVSIAFFLITHNV